MRAVVVRLRRGAGRLRAWCAGADPGAVTAEFAVVMPAVILVVALLLYSVRACVVQLECQDAASNAARAAVVQGPDASLRDVAMQSAPSVSQVDIVRADGRVRVEVRCKVVSDPMGVLPASVVATAIGVDQEE
ncbi:TadE family protein [Bifidobacterium cuniculi]|uniref:TadE family protein n=1 Tax=Bifidobacterium cuniculi TaxID=1688 RepID=A0A087B2R5_9BIFI|nr:TadE family protein [Bifidobacterium cuniculi]